MDEKAYQEFCESIKQLVASGYEVMLYHQGFGETAIFLQVLYKYRELHGKKIFALTYQPTRTELLEASEYIEEVLQVPEDVYVRLCKDVEFRREYGIIDFLTMHQYELDRSTMRKEVCDYLGIPKDTPYQPYVLPEVNANWDEYFQSKNLIPEKTVYIVPYAVFLGKVVEDIFWTKLVERLKKAGYTAIINMPEELVPGVPYAYFDIIPSLRLAEKCGYVIGARTGFMDLVAAFTNLPLQVIYPDDTNPAWQVCKEYDWKEPVYGDYAKRYMETTGIHTLFPRDGVEELVYTNDDEILDAIMENLPQERR